MAPDGLCPPFSKGLTLALSRRQNLKGVILKDKGLSVKGLDSWLEGFQEEEKATGALRIGQRGLPSAPRPGQMLPQPWWYRSSRTRTG